MPKSILLKHGKDLVGVRYIISIIVMTLTEFFLAVKLKIKIQKMKRRLKNGGVKYEGKVLFNNTNNNVIFIHIPKAAGMSVVKTLYDQNRSHHASVTDYINEDEVKYSQTFSFAITRNPYTRLYSAYNYLKSGGMNNIDRAWYELYLAKYDSFEAFIVKGGLAFAINNNAEHFIPQYKFVFDERGKLLVNHLGKIENLHGTEAILTDKLQKEIAFSRRNVVSKADVDLGDIYSNKMLEIVNHSYQKDFLLFGYDVR